MLLEELTSAAYLNCERDLLADAESRDVEFVWTWESSEHAVVVGRSCKPSAEADLDACDADRVPVLRRESGGGAVLVGPGCLNYSLIVSLERRPELRDVEASYGVILDSVVRALGVSGVEREGTDLILLGRKFAGCSQRRLRRTMLHHGTILYGFDLAKVSRYLREPVHRPAHRGARTHAEFLTNVRLDSGFATRLAAEFPGAKGIA